MRPARRPLLHLALCAALASLALTAGPAAAQAPAWPAKPIRLVVPYPPGGPTDVLLRIVGAQLAERLGQPVLIDNKPGASGMVGADMVAKAPADGYTLLGNASIHVINPSLYPKTPYDAIKDFTPVSLVAEVPLVLVVSPALAATQVKDVIALAKAKPGALAFASSGNAAAPHLAGEAFKHAAGVDLLHVPYKGSGPALTDLMGGQVQLMFDSMPSSMPFIQAGKLRALAVTTARRSTALPQLPTVAEAGLPGFDMSTWYGLWAPAGTPREVVARLGTEVAAIVRLPAVRERLLALGAEPVGNTPDEFAAFNRSELAKWARIVKQSGARVD